MNTEEVTQNGAPTVTAGEMTSSDYYFDFYGDITTHKDMLKDRVSMLAYRNAIYHNKHLFEGKIVLDIGCGTGILSMFAAKAGAAKVIAVECSKIADFCQKIFEENKLDDVITLVRGKVEEISLPDGIKRVDIIISQWMGYCLFYGAMLNTVLFARDKWLRSGGMMFPDRCLLYLTAIEDKDRKYEKIDWWNAVYGFNMSIIRKVAISDPLVECIDPKKVVTTSYLVEKFCLYTMQKADLEFESPFSLLCMRDDAVHALVTYFEVQFTKCHKRLGFSTSPEWPCTHWRQSLFYFEDQLSVKKGERIHGLFKMKPNAKNNRDLDFSFDVQFQGRLSQLNENIHYKMHNLE